MHHSPPAEPQDRAAVRPLLNDPQRRHFDVLLGMMEDALAELEWLAAGRSDAQASLTIYDLDVPAAAVDAVGPATAAVRARIGHLAAELGLVARHRSTLQRMRALLVAEMVRLEDSTADKLRGYGEVNPEVATRLDPVLHEMHGELTALLRLLHPEPAADGSLTDGASGAA